MHARAHSPFASLLACLAGLLHACHAHPTNLAGERSPLASTTAGLHNHFTGCGGTAGRTRKFFLAVPPGVTVVVGQTANSFDSQHSAFWSASTDPASYPKRSVGSSCTDTPDTRAVNMTNAGSVPRKLWFVVNGYDSSNSYAGTFTLAWSCTRGGRATSCVVTRSPTGVGQTWSPSARPTQYPTTNRPTKLTENPTQSPTTQAPTSPWVHLQDKHCFAHRLPASPARLHASQTPGGG